MPKIIVTVGISGSGKTTWAKDYMVVNTHVIRVCRDNLREMLFGYEPKYIVEYYNSPNLQQKEKEITNFEDNIIKNALIKGKDVIVDATHLQLRYCNRFKNFAVPVQYELFDVPLQVCIDRDTDRERQVGKGIIRNQHANLTKLKSAFKFESWEPSTETIQQDNSLPPCVIFDIDGTLAIKGFRSPYDWAKVGEDTINEAVAHTLVCHYEAKQKIIICTGRDGSCESETLKWLADYYIPYDRFYIRPAGNNEKDYIIKERMWREIAKNNYIACLYDDRDQVVFHGRSLGLSVFQVNYGDF